MGDRSAPAGKLLVLSNHSYMLYRFRLELLLHLQKTHEIVLCMPFVGHEDDFRALGFRCIEAQMDRRKIDPTGDLRLFSFYRKLLLAEQPYLVLCYSIKPNIYGGLACRILRQRYCLHVQGLGSAFERPLSAAFATGMYRLAAAHADRVFFENESNASYFLSRRIVAPGHTVVLPGAGVSLSNFRAIPYPQNDVFRFLFLGRFMREKGLQELFSAAMRLHAEGVRFQLDLLGFFEEPYERRIAQLKVLGIIDICGFYRDTQPFYAAADCIVLPSYHEGMSNVLLEAAAMGRPVIASDIPGCRETVEDGVSGFLCRVGDAHDLYEKMLAMTRLPTQKRAAMGTAARIRAERYFDRDRVVAQTVAALPL